MLDLLAAGRSIATPWFDSGTFWTAVGSLAGAAALLIAAVSSIRAYFLARRTIIYSVAASFPLISYYPGVTQALKVLHDDKELVDPYVLEIQLASKARRDIPSASFDQGQPLRVDVGVPIISLNKIDVIRKSDPKPKVEIDGATLKIGPSLIRKRQEITLAVLVDGPDARLSCQSPIIDVRMRRKIAYERGQMRLRQIVSWAAVAFVAFYLITQPSSAGLVVHDILNGLRNAGDSLATFFNSI